MTRSLPSTPLVLPAPGDKTTANLLRRVWLHAMRGLLEHPTAQLHALLDINVQRLRKAVVHATRCAPEATLTAIAAPDVLVPLLTMLADESRASAALAVTGPNLLSGLASLDTDGLLPDAPIAWTHPVTSLADCRAGRAATFDPPATDITFARGRVARAGGTDISWHAPYHAIEPMLPTTHLATLDTNPLRNLEAHPDKHGNAMDLGGQSIDAWRSGIVAALELVDAALPTLRDELSLTMARVVPVGYDDHRHLSASYREAPGLVYMTLHPNAVTMAEAIVHETQHGKLNAMTWFDPVLRNAHSEWTASPVRPDLRPLFGVLLAAHAFVPVAALHLRLAEMDHPTTRDPWFHRRRVEVVETNAKSMDTVARLGDFTRPGRALFRGLEALHAVTRDAL